MNEPTSGVVSTPPKSEITARMATSFSGSPDDLVERCPRAAVKPEAEGDHVSGLAALDGVTRRAEGVVVSGSVELDAEAANPAGGGVLGREQCLLDLVKVA